MHEWKGNKREEKIQIKNNPSFDRVEKKKWRPEGQKK
jgi:hypothetical protein